MDPRIDRSSIEATYETIRPHVRVTPVVELDGADLGLAPFAISLKLEQMQFAGSFKTRGAFANLLSRDVPAAGVVAASGGNHGAAVAYAARRLLVPARIFVPRVASPTKIERIRSYGADLVIEGERYADALAASEAWAAKAGALQIHAFDQRETLLGQGTVALELSSQAPLPKTCVADGGLDVPVELADTYVPRELGESQVDEAVELPRSIGEVLQSRSRWRTSSRRSSVAA